MKKKILVIIPIFPGSNKDDTIVPFIFQFLRYFSDDSVYSDDLEIDIISLRYPIKKRSYTIGKLTIYPIGAGFKGKISIPKNIIKSTLKGWKLHKKNNYDGILSFWYGESAIIGNILKYLTGIKHLTWLQGQDVKASNKFIKLFPPNPENLILVGENHQKLLKDYVNISAKKIANVSVDPKYFPELNTQNRTIDILGVGNIVALKNYSFFIEIIADLKEHYPNIKVKICGDGEEKKMLLDKIKMYNLQDNVILAGYTTNVAVRDLMITSKILLHTSLFEGNSMVIQEALFSGCKVISTIPVSKNIKNFYCEQKKDKIINRIHDLFANTEGVQRVQPFLISETAREIYTSFFDSNS